MVKKDFSQEIGKKKMKLIFGGLGGPLSKLARDFMGEKYERIGIGWCVGTGESKMEYRIESLINLDR